MARTVLFLRRFRGLTGGHLKVRDYFGHIAASGTHTPFAWFTDDTRWDDSNPWRDARANVVATPTAVRPDVLFLAGLDWRFLTRERRERPEVPVVNLVQHIRHADPADERFEFLRHPAVRVCVSREVADAVTSAGANGPVVAIPNGIDPATLPPLASDEERDLDVCIAGLKSPDVATGVAQRLLGLGRIVGLFTTRAPRPDFLDALRRARVAVLLPHTREGFYLPALESMALRTLTVVPDCVGNRSFCVDGVTCLMPAPDEAAVVAAAGRALAFDEAAARALRDGASAMVARHSAKAERSAFLDVLARLDELWTSRV